MSARLIASAYSSLSAGAALVSACASLLFCRGAIDNLNIVGNSYTFYYIPLAIGNKVLTNSIKTAENHVFRPQQISVNITIINFVNMIVHLRSFCAPAYLYHSAVYFA